MLSRLAALVGNPDGNLEEATKGFSIDGISSERANTASTAATDEVLLETMPFLVEVVPETDSNTLGIIVSMDDNPGYLTIDDIQPTGLIAQWNASHGADLAVLIGHTITSVNGISNIGKDMLASIKSLRKTVPLQLLIQAKGAEEEPDEVPDRQQLIVSIDDIPDNLERPPKALDRSPFIVQLCPGKGTPLGLAVSIDDDPSYVSIDDIASVGLVAEWNKAQREELNVLVGDTIRRIGRCSGSGREMLGILTSIQSVNRGVVLELAIEPQSRKGRRNRARRRHQG